MTRRCILHFGMHKTGSTSIQATFFRLNQNDLPWTYLNAGVPNSSEPLLNMFMEHPEAYQFNIKKGLDRDKIESNRKVFFKRFEEQIAASDKDFLLSAEGISELSEAELGRLSEWLGRFAGEVLLVGYVRPPRAYMESGFQQNVKGGQGIFNLQNLYPHYQKRFGKFEVVFGREAVHYWVFDTSSFPGGCVVRDFATRLGAKLADKQVVRVNEGLSREALSILYCYRKCGGAYGVGPGVIRENQNVITKLSELKGHKVRFSPDLVREVLLANQLDVKWMEERLGKPFAEDIEARSEFDIANEDDLLKCSPESLEKLRQWVGVPSSEPANTPQQVAKLLGQLRRALSERSSESDSPITCNQHNEAKEMTLTELFGKVKSAHPEQFETINDKKAVAILRAAFSEIKKEIVGTEDGVVKVPSLGNFRITQVEREVEGKKVVRRRVAFHAAVANSKKGD